MTLPLLQILGHQIASKDCSAHSSTVSTNTKLYFGVMSSSLIMDQFANTNKIPKTRVEKGEFIALFEFPDHNCCPVQALKCLKEMSNIKGFEQTPVFTFSNGKFLTRKKANKLLTHFLEPHLVKRQHPIVANLSVLYRRYTRLNHKAKKEIFTQFAEALSRT